MDAVFGTLLIRFFMIVCSLIVDHKNYSGHMYEFDSAWQVQMNSLGSIHTDTQEEYH